ncbi:MAG: hypothetical protein A2Y40_03135 [Candidatus Margulisbacteria bacterium GWF2_35_9]|nr:MAG: hypothetical protein A2Y40_03135 [Candidatus Margulisbacteria bacterium GWF2_35_9]
MEKEETTKKLIHQLKIVRGQIDGIIKMVEKQNSCTDILTQTAAADKGLKRAATLLLENQMYNCAQSLEGADDMDHKVQELLSVFKKFL